MQSDNKTVNKAHQLIKDRIEVLRTKRQTLKSNFFVLMIQRFMIYSKFLNTKTGWKNYERKSKTMVNDRPNLADVYVGRHLAPYEALIINDTRFKWNTEMMIRSYIDAYYFMLEVQGDRKRAEVFTLTASTAIRRMLEMMIEIELIPRESAITIYSICKFIGTDLNINERVKDEWI